MIDATGTRAHSARSWLGDNAIHKLGAVRDRLAAYRAREVDIDGQAIDGRVTYAGDTIVVHLNARTYGFHFEGPPAISSAGATHGGAGGDGRVTAPMPGKIVKVAVLVQPTNTLHDVQIGEFAFPKLISETLTAQDAKIDAVSGASYTSAGYIQSPQSALDKST